MNGQVRPPPLASMPLLLLLCVIGSTQDLFGGKQQELKYTLCLWYSSKHIQLAINTYSTVLVTVVKQNTKKSFTSVLWTRSSEHKHQSFQPLYETIKVCHVKAYVGCICFGYWLLLLLFTVIVVVGGVRHFGLYNREQNGSMKEWVNTPFLASFSSAEYNTSCK